MIRRDFLKLASAGLLACAAAGLPGCAPALASTTTLADKRQRLVVDTSAALAGELEQSLSVVSAESCREGMEALLDSYHATHPNVAFPNTSFAPTGQLLDRIRADVPDLAVVDLNSIMAALEAEGLVNRALQMSPFATRLCLVASRDAESDARTLEDLAGDGVSKVVIGNADTMFTGVTANQALYSAGLYTAESGVGGAYDPTLAGKLGFVDSLSALADALADDSRAVGFMSAAEVVATPGIEVIAEIVRTKYRAMSYLAAPTGTGAQATYVLDFLDFCANDDEAQRIEARYGLSKA